MVVRVTVVNDCDLVVAGVKALVGPYFHRARFVEPRDAAPMRDQVDVVLDGSVPRPGSLLIPTGLSGRPQVVAFGWGLKAGGVQSLLGGGVRGYIFKGSPADELIDSIERVHRGEFVGHQESSDSAAVRSLGRWPGDHEGGLSAQESAVMTLICQGLSNREIAAQIFVSINTVKTYIRSAYRKISTETRPQAVIWGLSHGFGTHPNVNAPAPLAGLPRTVA